MSYLHHPNSCDEHHGLVRDFGGSPDKMARPTITVLCGSTRFGDAFVAENLRRTLAGEIVLTIGCDMRSDNELWSDAAEAERIKTGLDWLHLRKIDLADQVMVLNVGGYIGDSTRAEIAYAQQLGRIVFYLEHPDSWPSVPVPEPQAARKRTNDEIRAGYPPLVVAVFDEISATYRGAFKPKPIGLPTVHTMMEVFARISGAKSIDDLDTSVLLVDDRAWRDEVVAEAGYVRAGFAGRWIVELVANAWIAVAARPVVANV